MEEKCAVLAWNEPDGLAARGTLIVIPGRGEQPGLYERFGRRLGSDAYRVRVVADPTAEEALARTQISEQLADPGALGPRVLVGSDAGALYAVALAASGQLRGIDALVLAGLPTAAEAGAAGGSFDEELESRTSCPAHRARLSAPGLRRGALYEAIPAGWLEQADLARVTQPVLGIHGSDDTLSPLARARVRYAAAPSAELVSIVGGKHDALNDQTHRTVAATVVLFLERLRLGSGLPRIAVTELPGREGQMKTGHAPELDGQEPAHAHQ